MKKIYAVVISQDAWGFDFFVESEDVMQFDTQQEYDDACEYYRSNSSYKRLIRLDMSGQLDALNAITKDDSLPF